MVINAILRLSEGKTLEFKRDASSSKQILKTLVAFANSAGGKLVIGVEDRSRNVVGVPDPRGLEERLANLVADSIEPRLLPEIEVVAWRDTQLLVVEVYPSALRPHYVKTEGSGVGTYVRLGSTNRAADAPLIAELARGASLESYDEQPLSDLDSEVIDFAAASQSFEGARTLRRKDLVALGVIRQIRGRPAPTIGGLVLFGRERLTRFPDAWIQVGRFAGTDKSELVDQAELRDLPIEAIERAIAFVERHTVLGTDIGRLRRRTVHAVPPVALREALVNAVAHGDYSQRGAPTRVSVFDDRVEIENPGILLPGLTIDELSDGISRIRNRVIGRVLKEIGFIEQWGSGIQRMTAACRDAGLPAPEFTEIGLRFRATLRTVPTGPANVDAVEQRLLDFVAAPEGRSTAEIARHIGLTTRATQHRLARLAERGLVVAVGSGPRDPRRRWFVTRGIG